MICRLCNSSDNEFVPGKNICKECRRAADRKRYKESDNVKSKARAAKYQKIRKDYVWDYLISHPCVDCGEADPVVLEFDHQRDKEMNITFLLRKNFQRLVDEIEKCEVRCCNCHRRRTTIQLGWWRGLDRSS